MVWCTLKFKEKGDRSLEEFNEICKNKRMLVLYAIKHPVTLITNGYDVFLKYSNKECSFFKADKTIMCSNKIFDIKDLRLTLYLEDKNKMVIVEDVLSGLNLLDELEEVKYHD